MRMITRALKRNLLRALTKSRQAKKRAREIWCWLCEQKHEEKAEREMFPWQLQPPRLPPALYYAPASSLVYINWESGTSQLKWRRQKFPGA